jgi:CoA:oxalate CoA-transferase
MHREKTGRGQHYDGSMIDSLFAVLENAVVRYTTNGEIPGPLGCRHPTITPFQDFKTKDTAIVVAAGNDALWIKFCKAIGREDLVEDVRFKTNPLRTTHVGELIPILAETLSGKTTAEWSEIFAGADLPCSPINSIRDICEDPHIRYRKMLVEIEQPPVGKITIAGSPIRLTETPGEVYAPAPLLGQHSEEILRNILNCSQDEIDGLRQEGVINPHLLFLDTSSQ